MDYVPAEPLRRRLKRLSRSELRDRLHAVRALGAARGLRYLDDHSRPRTIELALMPWLVTRTQLARFQQLARLLSDALMRLPHLAARSPEVRTILSFDGPTASWMRLAARPAARPLAVMGRLDSTATFSHPRWRTDFRMLEPNGVGVGGVHYAPAGCSVLLEVIGDLLEAAYPGRRVTETPDPRRLLIDEMRAVGRRIGRRVRRVALIENQDYTTGTDEFASLAHALSGMGLEAVVADPREVNVQRGRLTVKGREIDLFYRDCELSEFIELEDAGHRLRGMRQAIAQGRLISGLIWEYDVKSSWEIFTDEAYRPVFTPTQQRFFAAYLPWTRLVREGFVTDARGRRIDLPAYIRRDRERLVMKPNTLYGGQGVVIGPRVSQRVWERELTRALRGSMRYVVQQVARLGVEEFPSLDGEHVHWSDRSVVSGFFFNSTDVGLVGRFSADPVVNISRGGGLLCALQVG